MINKRVVMLLAWACLLALGGIKTAKGQLNGNIYTTDITDKSEGDWEVRVNGYGAISARGGLQGSFIRDYLRDSYIEEETRQDLLDKMGKRVHLGGLGQYGMLVKSKLGEGLGIWGQINVRYNQITKLTRDAAQLVLIGNEELLGRSADLSNVIRQTDYFQTYTLGLEKIINANQEGGTEWRYGLGVGFVNYLNHNKFVSNDLTMYSTANADSISVSGTLSDTRRTMEVEDKGGSIGIGAAISGYAIYRKENTQFAFSMQDIGRARIDGAGRRTIDFSGLASLRSGDLREIGSANYFSELPDSLSAIVSVNDSTNSNLNVWLPGILSLSGQWQYSDKITYQAGIDYVMGRGYLPRIQAKMRYQFGYGFYTKVGLQGLGYSVYGIVAAVGIQKSSWNMEIGTEQLEGLIVSSIGSGQALTARLRYVF